MTYKSNGDVTVNGSLFTTANMTIGTNNSYPDLRLGSANGNNIGIATTATAFSNSSAINDMVIRSINRLILHSGGAGHAILIDSSNNVSCGGTINANGNKLNFPNTLEPYKINLWGTNNHGFGIAASTLQYSRQGNHTFIIVEQTRLYLILLILVMFHVPEPLRLQIV